MTLAAIVAAGVLHGTVTVGPLTPVCRVGTPCDGPAKHVRLAFTRRGRSTTVETDGAGVYRVRLAPGVYAVRANVGLGLRPRTVAVRRGAKRVDFAVDTGIR